MFSEVFFKYWAWGISFVSEIPSLSDKYDWSGEDILTEISSESGAYIE